jgi:hypothetical protein
MDIKKAKNRAKTCILWSKQGIGAFLQENWAYRGLSARNRGPEHNYA